MDAKTTVSAKGQIVIPKLVREAMGLHYGSELTIHMRADNVLEFKPIKKNLSDFFGMGARKAQKYRKKEAPVDIDEAITEAVSENNPVRKKGS
ncbi:MAG: hypothetical protein K0R76_799 [Alphaproteobacteria bacterium]|nr:hypothetical protein [Alphaproteobacteria bacterium]MDF3033845.1 hypothetical protein [Alphaproteobacteria bacterium]